MNKKKGMTLIEVVVSIAVILIIIAGASALTGTVIKNRQYADLKQTATMLGQDIMEELQLIDGIPKLNGMSYIPLSGLNDLIKEDTADTLQGSYVATIENFNVSLQLSKGEYENEEQGPSNIQYQIEIAKDGDNFKVVASDKSLRFSKSSTLIMTYQSQYITISDLFGGNQIQLPVGSKTPSLLVMLNMDSNVNLQLNNKDTLQPFNVYVATTSKANTQDVLTLSGDGWVKVYHNALSKSSKSLYHTTLQIKYRDQVLFEALGNKHFSQEAG